MDDFQRSRMRSFLKHAKFRIEKLDTPHPLEIEVRLEKGNHSTFVHIVDFHTNVVRVERDEEVLYSAAPELSRRADGHQTDRSLLNMTDIFDFAQTVDVEDIRPIISRQICCNMAIAEEGLKHPYGANVGKVLIGTCGTDIQTRAKAKAAAASDARMSGCELPVVINSGSGNQGITCSVPVIEYARELHASEETLYRALVLSNLTTIHLKTGIGTLSAFCGAVSAGAGAGAGIAYLTDGSFDTVKHTVVNHLAMVSGIICDGAKPSCAGKIAASIDAALLGLNMYKRNQQFYNGDGIVMQDIEETVKGVGIIGREGMRSTNDDDPPNDPGVTAQHQDPACSALLDRLEYY